MKLFCFPYAGGSAGVYRRWEIYLSPSIELVPIELAGRGVRIDEPCCQSIEEAVSDLYGIVSAQLDGSEYAFFGHGMGSTIIFELSHKIKQTGFYGPACLFFSGSDAPHIKNNSRMLHTLPDEELKKEILSLGGACGGLFENTERSKIFIHILRADYKMLENYKYAAKEDKLEAEVTILYGKKGSFSGKSMHEWNFHSVEDCTIHCFNGGHFFINDNEEEVLEVLNYCILRERGNHM